MMSSFAVSLRGRVNVPRLFVVSFFVAVFDLYRPSGYTSMGGGHPLLLLVQFCLLIGRKPGQYDQQKQLPTL